MSTQDADYVLKVAREANVRFIRLWFTDVLGFLKGFAITIAELEDALENGVGFDGASIQGYARRDEADMVARPDASTFEILPYRPREQGAVARMFCDIYQADGQPYAGDPRAVLRRTVKRASDLGYTYYVGPELEFFYFRSATCPPGTGRPEVLDRGGYFDLLPTDLATDLRRDTILTLEEMGIPVEFSHHEGAPSQHEIDLRYTDALTMADNLMTFRLVVKEIAQRHNVYATFMPKPLQGSNGSGMHINQSLFKGDENAFASRSELYHLSPLAQHHVAEITLVLNQWVNSYKRLVPGYEAPTYVSWALQNRGDLVRIPTWKEGREQSVRIELRSPDPATNPYLAFAVILAAGLDGIQRELPLPGPATRNVAEMTDAERREMGIGSLPENLHEAIELAEQSQLLRDTLGQALLEKLIENKKLEWSRYRGQVTDYELQEYLPLL
jgi:glutamine synthetase